MPFTALPGEDFPTLREWFEQAPPGRLALFAIASFCTLITNILGWKLMLQHVRAGGKESEVVVFFPEIRKKAMYQIFWVNVLSGTAYIGLLLPRTYLFLEFLMATYEAWALLGFMRMLIDLMGGRLRMLKILQEQPPKKLFSVMPCCCLILCDHPRNMTAGIIAICRLGALQATVVRPLLAAVNLFIQLNGGYLIWTSNSYLMIDLLELASKMTSVFFIFVLYGSTQEILKDYNIKRKFILLRLMFIPFIVQASIISFIYTFLEFENEDDIFPAVVAVQSWGNALTCIEVLPIAIYLFFVYPAHGEFDLEHVPQKNQLTIATSSTNSITDEDRSPLLSKSKETRLLSDSGTPPVSAKQFYLSMGYQSAENLQTFWNQNHSNHPQNGSNTISPTTSSTSLRPREYRSVACQVDFDHDQP